MVNAILVPKNKLRELAADVFYLAGCLEHLQALCDCPDTLARQAAYLAGDLRGHSTQVWEILSEYDPGKGGNDGE